MSKELRHRNEVERTYSRTVFDISENKIDRLAFRTRNRNLDRADAFKTNTTANTTVIAVITVRNIGEVRDGAGSVVSTASVEYPVVL